jgi:hypothetical protein
MTLRRSGGILLRVVVVGAAVVGIYPTVLLIMSWEQSIANRKTWNSMQASPFPCPDGLEVKIEGWGENGFSRSCETKKEGKWEAWEAGAKVIDGEYRNGKRHGRWLWYRHDGSVSRTIVYDEGVEVERKDE